MACVPQQTLAGLDAPQQRRVICQQGNSEGASVLAATFDTMVSSLGPRVLTCGGCAQDHRLSLGHAQIPDSITVAHVLPEQLAQSPGPCGGLEAGHNLDKAGRRRDWIFFISLQVLN